MALATRNFSIRPGATKVLQFTWYTRDPVTKVKTPVDLSTYSGRMQIRSREGDPTLLLELSTSNGKMSLTNQGIVLVTISPNDSASYAAKRAVYDIMLSNNVVYASGTVIVEFVSGIVSLDTGVTV
jgi:hypothetical protein